MTHIELRLVIMWTPIYVNDMSQSIYLLDSWRKSDIAR